jgi:hypothetical protein
VGHRTPPTPPQPHLQRCLPRAGWGQSPAAARGRPIGSGLGGPGVSARRETISAAPAPLARLLRQRGSGRSPGRARRRSSNCPAAQRRAMMGRSNVGAAVNAASGGTQRRGRSGSVRARAPPFVRAAAAAAVWPSQAHAAHCRCAHLEVRGDDDGRRRGTDLAIRVRPQDRRHGAGRRRLALHVKAHHLHGRLGLRGPRGPPPPGIHGCECV